MAQIARGKFGPGLGEAGAPTGSGVPSRARGIRYDPATGQDGVDRGGAGRRLAEALRLSEVPKGVLVAIAVLALTAACLGWVLHGRMGAMEVLSRGGEDAAGDGAPTAGGESTEAPSSLDGEPGAASAGEGGETEKSVLVHVAGAVAVEGVYELPEGSRVQDAVEAAGGWLPQADLTSLNLAAVVQDGTKVYIPTVGEAPAASGAAASGGTGAVGEVLININTASVEELDALPGVGESTAQAIVDDREQLGPFASPEDLMRVSGIGEKKFAKLQEHICV